LVIHIRKDVRSRTLSHICPLTFSTTQKRKHRHWDVAKLEIIYGNTKFLTKYYNKKIVYPHFPRHLSGRNYRGKREKGIINAG
jgi:hypothetical protein